MFRKIFATLFVSIVVLACINLIMGCSHNKKEIVEEAISNTEFSPIIDDANQKIKKAYENQWDVLAAYELKQSEKNVAEAYKLNTGGYKLSKIDRVMKDFNLNYREGELLAQARAPRVEELLAARKLVLTSGVRQLPEDDKKLALLDQKFRKHAESNLIDVQKFTALVADYKKLANDMIKIGYLRDARRMVQVARFNKAKKYAPRSLNIAEIHLRNAEDIIDSNRGNNAIQQRFALRATTSANILTEVIEEQKKANYKMAESAAITIVQQRALKNQYESGIANTEMELFFTNAELQSLKEKHLQMALVSTQKHFSKGEASINRQGDKILIHIKKIEFPVKKTKSARKSDKLLNKVATAAKELGPQEMVLQGSENTINPMMSYLQTNGISKSVLQSKTDTLQSSGVDILITPAPPIEKTE